MKKTIVNWGILSTAKIGWEHVIPAIQKSKNSKVLGLASRNLSKAQSLCKKFKISKSYGSYEELYQDPDIDIIYNPLPNHLHIKTSLKAALIWKTYSFRKTTFTKSKRHRPFN
jgi:predicted dehydrogenase